MPIDNNYLQYNKVYPNKHQQFHISKISGNPNINIDASNIVIDASLISINGDIDLSGNIIPTINETFDLGTPEFRFRDLFLSNASIWFGDENKISINTNGKFSSKKRKTNIIPAFIRNHENGHSNITDLLNYYFGSGHSKTINDMKLKDWKAYTIRRGIRSRKTFDISEVFSDSTSDDWERIVEGINESDLLTSLSNLNIDISNNNFDFSGNLIVNGNISATTFYGDGSNLTGISSGGGGSSNLDNVIDICNNNGNYFCERIIGPSSEIIFNDNIINISGGKIDTQIIDSYNYITMQSISDPCNNNILFNSYNIRQRFIKIAYSSSLNIYVLLNKNNILYSYDGINFYIGKNNGSDLIFTGLGFDLKWFEGNLNKFFISNTHNGPQNNRDKLVYYSSDGINWSNANFASTLLLSQCSPKNFAYSSTLGKLIVTASGNGNQLLYVCDDTDSTFTFTEVYGYQISLYRFLPNFNGSNTFSQIWDSNIEKFILITDSGTYTTRIFYNTNSDLSGSWTAIPIRDNDNNVLTGYINYILRSIAFSPDLNISVVVGNVILYSGFTSGTNDPSNLYFRVTKSVNGEDATSFDYNYVTWDPNGYFIACGGVNMPIIYSSNGINWYHNNTPTCKPESLYNNSEFNYLTYDNNSLHLVSNYNIFKTDPRYTFNKKVKLYNNENLILDNYSVVTNSLNSNDYVRTPTISTNNIYTDHLILKNNNKSIITDDGLEIMNTDSNNNFLKLSTYQSNKQIGIILNGNTSTGIDSFEKFRLFTNGNNNFYIYANKNQNKVLDINTFGNTTLGYNSSSVITSQGSLICNEDVTINKNLTIDKSLQINETITIPNQETVYQFGNLITGGIANEKLGYSVSLSDDGTIIAIGSYQNNTNGNNSGSVKVYKIISGSWTQMGQTVGGVNSDDRFGTSVSISSNGYIFAAGATLNDGSGSNAGHVRVFEYIENTSTWVQLGTDIDGETADDRMGTSVSLSSNGYIVVAGAIYNDTNGSNSGHVKVFEYNTGTSDWVQLGSSLSGETAGDFMGTSVSLSSNGYIVAAGAIYDDTNGSNSGHVKVFEYNTGTSDWVQLGSSLPGESSDDRMGTSVSLSSNGYIVAIGAINDDANGGNSGHVRVFEYNTGTSDWIQLGSDIDGEATNDRTGRSVSLSNDGTLLLIGANENDGVINNAGHARLYQYSSSNWVQIGSDIEGYGDSDYFGFSVALSGNGSTLAIGGYQYDTNNSNTGGVKVLKYDYTESFINGISIKNGKIYGDGSNLTNISLNNFSDASFGNVEISGNLEVQGDVSFNSNLDISGNLTLKGSLGVLDSSTNNISYGNVGSVLTSNGASAPSWNTPSVGLSGWANYYLTATLTNTSPNPVTTWTDAGLSVGSIVSLSSGVFTFSSTGYYKVVISANTSQCCISGNVYLEAWFGTETGSIIARAGRASYVGTDIGATEQIFQVTNTGTQSLYFKAFIGGQSGTHELLGGGNDATKIFFYKLN